MARNSKKVQRTAFFVQRHAVRRTLYAVPVFCLFILTHTPLLFAQTYDEMRQAVAAAIDPGRQVSGLTEQQVQVRSFWEAGKLIDDYLLEREERATAVVNQLAADLKLDPSRLYYGLQFVRAYPDAPPAMDLPWGYFQYLLAINDPREREAVAARAFDEKWNWDKLRAEIQIANRENREFVFTDVPGKTGVYRIVKATRGPERGNLVLDLGFSVYFKPARIVAGEYEIVQAECRDKNSACVFTPAPGAEKDLFTYTADVVHVMDGDTFQAVIDLGLGHTTLQTFRLWGLDAPEINTRAGRKVKRILEDYLMEKPVILRAMTMEKYGRYLADVWTFTEDKKPVYINALLLERGLAEKGERAR